MRIARTFLALLIAFSVAVLPAAGGVAAVQSAESADVSAMDDMDCCPQKSNPCEKTIGNCSSMATCALKCFSFSAAPFSDIEFPLQVASLRSLFGANPFHPQTSSPPFRPPRV